ncbi:MAG: glycosyltransferase family 39 protein [Candidatus Sumerlaeota bacterium]|nr:glycosyltransferase family 39 protein [Candidatus Sumerlaeota bacterium]
MLWLLAIIGTLWTSLLLARMLGIAKVSLLATATLAIFHCLITVYFWVAGIFSLHPHFFLAFILIDAVGLSLLHRFYLARELKLAPLPLDALRHAPRSDFLLLAPLGLLIILLIILGLKLGPRYGDAVEYHLVEPVRWVQARSLTWEGMGRYPAWPPISRVHGFPNTAGIMAFFHMTFTGDLNAGALSQVSFALMGLAALYALARELGLRRRLAILAIYFAVFIPEFLLQFTESYADLAMAGCLVTAILFLFLYIKTGSRQWLLLFCAAAGLVGGVKNTGVIFSLVLFLCALSYHKMTNLPRQKTLSLFLLFGSLWLLLAGPWYLHNAIRYGNPLYPIKVHLFGKTLFDGPFPMDGFTRNFMERRTNNYLHAIWLTYREDESGVGLAQMFGGLGSAFFILGIPALFISLARAFLKKDNTFIAVWALFLILYLFQPVKWYARFSLPLAFFSGLCLASLLQNARRLERSLMLAVIFTCLTYNGVKSLTALSSNFLPPDFWYFALRTGDYSPQQFNQFPGNYSVRQYVREHFIGRRAILYYFPNVGPVTLMPRDMKLRLITFGADKEPWFGKMLSEKVDYVYTCTPQGSVKFAREESWLRENPQAFPLIIEGALPGAFRGQMFGEPLALERLYRVNKQELRSLVKNGKNNRQKI